VIVQRLFLLCSLLVAGCQRHGAEEDRLDPNQVELRGLLFAKNFPVILDLDQNQLIIKGQRFPGRPLAGTSPLAQGARYRGMSFECTSGDVFGKAAILILDDGRAAIDFDKVFVHGVRAHEYGIVSGEGK